MDIILKFVNTRLHKINENTILKVNHVDLRIHQLFYLTRFDLNFLVFIEYSENFYLGQQI
jgi:hypothetical protein